MHSDCYQAWHPDLEDEPEPGPFLNETFCWSHYREVFYTCGGGPPHVNKLVPVACKKNLCPPHVKRTLPTACQSEGFPRTRYFIPACVGLGVGRRNRVVPRASLGVLGQKGSFAADVPQFCVSAGCAGGRGGRAPACAFWTFYSIWMFWGLEE